MIFIDPTESRERTLLPKNIIKSSQPLPGLETATGADILISPLKEPKLSKVDSSALSQVMFHKHLSVGALVQRKHGQDFLSSIPNLDNILYRMKQVHARANILLKIGHFEKDQDGLCVVSEPGSLPFLGGHKNDSKWKWISYLGARNQWQFRGGYLIEIESAEEILQVLEVLTSELTQALHEKTHLVTPRIPLQQLSESAEGAEVLVALVKGLGYENAKAILQSQGTLAWALSYLSNEENLKYAKIPGVGIESFRKARTRLGLEKGQVLYPGTLEDENGKS